jgi:negative regulator of replication initiation
MVRNISGSVNDELYEMIASKGNQIGLKSSAELIRYAFAIACGYSENKAKIIAKIKPQFPFSEFQNGE